MFSEKDPDQFIMTYPEMNKEYGATVFQVTTKTSGTAGMSLFQQVYVVPKKSVEAEKNLTPWLADHRSDFPA